MAAPRLDRRTLSTASPPALRRLARFVGVRVPDDCACPRCVAELVEVLVRHLDAKEEAWPPPRYERAW